MEDPMRFGEPIVSENATAGRRQNLIEQTRAFIVPSPMDRQTLIFLHIPKTAGTTLNRIIEWQYSPFDIFTIDPYRIRATPERLERLPEDRRRRLRMVRGHMFYGVHKCLPQAATYFTMLRDPVARVLSAYYFVLRRPLNPLYRKVKKERLGIEDYVRLFPERHNLQCRLIAGVKDTPITDERLIDTAKGNLANSFSVVGISEQFEESLILMATTFEWQIPFYKNCKVSRGRPQIDSATKDMIRDYNRLDVELYEFGKELFAKSMQKNEARIRERLAELRALPKPSAAEEFCQSTLGAGRFFVNKIASAI